MFDTWGGRSEFDYAGDITTGTRIIYGNGNEVTVTAEHYQELLNHFRGKGIPVSPDRTDPAAGSLEAWLQTNFTRTAIASYVAPILINEGVATRSPDNLLQF